MYEFKSTELLQIVREIESLRDHTDNQKREIMLKYPSWDVIHDARLTIFAKVINVANSTQLALTFIGQHLLDPFWWQNTAKEAIPSDSANIYINEYNNFTKIGFVQFVFSSIESGFRIFLRALDPTACNNGAAEFKSIYECLLKSKLSSTPKESIELLDLLRFIRNTIHNNGIYYSRAGTNEQVIYKGRSYQFIYSKAVDFVTWGFIISVVRDLVDLAAQVVFDPNVVILSGTIQDPFALK